MTDRGRLLAVLREVRDIEARSPYRLTRMEDGISLRFLRDPAVERGMTYLRSLRSLRGAVPDGRVLVHNNIRPVARQMGTRGSRAWLQAPDERLEACDCGWAPELGRHYRWRGE